MFRLFVSMFCRFGMSIMLCLLFVTACSRAPKGIISEKKMRQIITDIYMADAIISNDPYTFAGDAEKKALYQSVFDKHRITEALYDSSLVWYGKNLDVYMQVNKMALADVNKQIEKINAIVESEKNITVNEDSVNIWSINRYHAFTPVSLSNTIIFRFRDDGNYSSGSIFVLGLQATGLGSQSSVDVHLHAQQMDTTIVLTNHINTDGYHEMILRTLPVQRVRQVYGYVRLNSGTMPFHQIYLDDFRMIKYRYGTPAALRLDSVAVMNYE